MKINSLSGLIGLIGLLVAVYAVVMNKNAQTRIGFVNTQKLMTGFKPAYEVEKHLQTEDEKFKSHLKILEDSLKSFMDSMAVLYQKANGAGKKRLQDQLAYKNQEINNISRAHARKMDEDRNSRMQGVYDKVNTYMGEFGKKEKYSIIFGTVQGGNILYGDGTSVDVTQKVLDGLNARYQ